MITGLVAVADRAGRLTTLRVMISSEGAVRVASCAAGPRRDRRGRSRLHAGASHAIAGLSGWELMAGELEPPGLAVGYRFYVNPARPALFTIMRYRVRATGTGKAPTEKFVWVERPGEPVPLRCFEVLAPVRRGRSPPGARCGQEPRNTCARCRWWSPCWAPASARRRSGRSRPRKQRKRADGAPPGPARRAARPNQGDRRMNADTFGARGSLQTSQGPVTIHRLSALEKAGLAPGFARMPFSIRVLLESVLRNLDGELVTGGRREEPGRVARPRPQGRGAALHAGAGDPPGLHGRPRGGGPRLHARGGEAPGHDPRKINPLVPVDLVVDHSVQVDYFASKDALEKNAAARVRAQPRALRVPALGPEGLPELPGGPTCYRHRPPGEPRVPGQGRRSRRRWEATRWPSPTPSWAPTPTPP